jgi:hypothetical protein
MAALVQQYFHAGCQMGALFSGGSHQRAADTAGQLDHARKTCGVRPRLSGSLDHKVVASNFALQIDLSGDPMHNWMQGEYRFEQALTDQRIIVATGEMSGLVKAYLVQLAFA